MCIICFLNETSQYALRKSAQIRSDRFEHTLQRYKSSFITEFEENLQSLCENHNNDNNKNIMDSLKAIDVRSIGNFFEKLTHIYVSWINAEISESISDFIQLLDEFNILESSENIDDLVLFRGRRSKDLISHWDMFHIPFNKRFHIGNQRYSLVGQPLLYLATSPYCVYRELENSENLRMSSYRFKEKCEMKIFNNSNLFYRFIKENNSNSSITITENMIESNLDSIEEGEIKKILFLAILSSCCSFQRRSELKNTSFCEEYVLPQMLAQILKHKEFQGVMYTSTKAYYDDNVNKDEQFINMIYKNICIFTNYDKDKVDDVTYVYDKSLYDKFTICAPVMFTIPISEGYYETRRSLELIKAISEKEHTMDLVYSINEVLVSYNDKNLSVKSDEKTIFYEATALHCLLLRNIILDIREK